MELAIVVLCPSGVKQPNKKKPKPLTSPKLPSVALEQASNTDEKTFVACLWKPLMQFTAAAAIE